jgi:MFS family permease
MGISEAFYIPAGLSLIVDYHQGKTRSIAVGIHTTGIYLGQAFGGFGATIASNFSWQWTFHLFGLIGITYCLVLILFLKEKKAYTIDHTQKTSLSKEFLQAYKGLGILFGNIAFWVILFYFSAPGVPGWAVKNWLPTLFSDTLQMDMAKAGPLATIITAMSSLVGVLIGGFMSDKWVQKNVRGRIFTGVIGLVFTIPALFLLGYGSGFVLILMGGLFFGLGFGMFDVNSMPILCQFVSPRYRATGYGLMNLAGISAGAFITRSLGKSADSGNMRQDFAMLSIIVIVAIILQLTILRPTTVNKEDPAMPRV